MKAYNLTTSQAASLRCLVRIELKRANNYLALNKDATDGYWDEQAEHYEKILNALGATK
jgi:hypothetical protein